MRTGTGYIVLCAVGMALTAAPANAQTSLTVGAFGNDANVLDPHLSGGGQDRALFGYMFNGVMRFAPGSMEFDAIELDLAESVTADEDGLVWTIVLEDGVQFHHGYGELTAEDVAFSLERAANPETSAFSATFGVIDTIEVVDASTLVVTLKERVPSFEGVLADPSGGLIISKRAVEELGDAVEAPLIGTGPFQFDSYTPGSRTVLTAHADYFRGAPEIDRIDYRYVPSENARELAFAAGEIDLFYGRREQDWVNRMRAQYGETIEIDIFAPSQSRMLHLNQSVEPLDDIRIRQAIAHAIDRDEFQLLVGPDITRQLESPVPSGFLGQTTDVPQYPHDPEKAKALLAEAGYPDGLTLAVRTSEIGSLKVPFELIMEQLRRVGITLEVDFVDHGAWHQLIRRNESPLVIYGAAPFPQADAFLSPFFLSSSIVGTPTAQTNFSHCDVADEEINAARSATDPDRQLELWADAQRKIMEEVCVVPIFELMQVWGRRNTLDLGYELTGTLNLGPPITEATTFRN
jgi:peptide/nickel transport system substrate-binding protein